ncbi:MAG: hypothetical protein ACRD0P_11860 [Stackebrandtia sp.]
MNTIRKLGTAGKLNVAGLAIGALALLTLKLGGAPDIPDIPPGVVIQAGGAALVFLGARWKWTAIIGVAIPVYLSVGAVLVPDTYNALSKPDETLLFTAMAVQLIAMAVALVSGVAALIRTYRKP